MVPGRSAAGAAAPLSFGEERRPTARTRPAPGPAGPWPDFIKGLRPLPPTPEKLTVGLWLSPVAMESCLVFQPGAKLIPGVPAVTAGKSPAKPWESSMGLGN